MNFHVLDASAEVSNQMHSGLLSHIFLTLSEYSHSHFQTEHSKYCKTKLFFLVRQEENKLLFLFVNISQELKYFAYTG